jgi:2'-5' RNA ligase
MPRRRQHRVQRHFRPALPRRSIIWLPQFAPEVAARIDRFRAQHDPLAPLVPPHVALVFPFHANLTALQLASHLKHVTEGWPVLPLTFRGVGRATSVNGLYTLLMCDLRRDAVVTLHDRLYAGPLAGFLRADIPYEPHLTLAADEDIAAHEATQAEAELYFRESYAAVLRDLALVRHHDDGTISFEARISLDRA